jgi:hypothetical protein
MSRSDPGIDFGNANLDLDLGEPSGTQTIFFKYFQVLEMCRAFIQKNPNLFQQKMADRICVLIFDDGSGFWIRTS